MIMPLIELPSALETLGIVAIAAVPLLLGAFVSWWVVCSLLDLLSRATRRR